MAGYSASGSDQTRKVRLIDSVGDFFALNDIYGNVARTGGKCVHSANGTGRPDTEDDTGGGEGLCVWGGRAGPA